MVALQKTAFVAYKAPHWGLDLDHYMAVLEPLLWPGIPNDAERWNYIIHLWCVGLPMRTDVWRRSLVMEALRLNFLGE